MLSLWAKAVFKVDTPEESHPKGDGGLWARVLPPLGGQFCGVFCTAPQSSPAGLSPGGSEQFISSLALLASSLPLVASQVSVVVKNLSANAGGARDSGWIPESGRSPGGGHGCPLQYSCLENPMDRGVRGITESDTIE